MNILGMTPSEGEYLVSFESASREKSFGWEALLALHFWFDPLFRLEIQCPEVIKIRIVRLSSNHDHIFLDEAGSVISPCRWHLHGITLLNILRNLNEPFLLLFDFRKFLFGFFWRVWCKGIRQGKLINNGRLVKGSRWYIRQLYLESIIKSPLLNMASTEHINPTEILSEFRFLFPSKLWFKRLIK